jgi:hypothetical protein
MSRVADRQYGHVTRQQLLELGLPSQTIARWVTNARLTRVHAGVYAVGLPQRGALPRAMAAVLACGDHAFLSHDSAAALWGVRPWPHTPEVLVPTEKRRPGIRTHRTQTLTTRDVRRHHGIRVTSPARTITDIQPRLTDPQLIRAINDLRLAKHMRQAELERLLAACPRAQALIDPAERPTRSPKEDAFLAFCAQYGLPRPQVNVILHGFEVDALFPEEKVIVEIDGWDFHKTRESFESDRDKDAELAKYGYLVVRVTSTRLKDTPAYEAERLLTTLNRRRS